MFRPARALASTGIVGVWKPRQYLTADFTFRVILSGDIDVPFTARKWLGLIRG
jgi:hypothetical protein